MQKLKGLEKTLPDGWEEGNLLKYVSLITTGVKPFKETRKYIRTGDLETSNILGYELVTFENRPSRANQEVQINDLLFAKMKNTEKLFKISKDEENYIFSTGFSIMRISNPNKIIPSFLYYWLRTPHFQKKKNRECIGSTQKAINSKSLKKFCIILPPLNLQYKIANILEKAEETKKLRVQADELANKLIQSVFLEMFGDPVINSKGWNSESLESVLDEIYRYPTFYGFDYVLEGIPVLKISYMTEEGGFLEDLNLFDKITKETNEKYPRTIVDEGDIILEVRGTYIGKCALVPSVLKGANVSPNAMRLSPNRSKVIPEYLLHLSFTKGWKMEIDKRTNYWKAGFGTIKSTDLKTMKILVPPLFLQKDFTKIVDKVKSMQQAQNKSNQQIDNLFNTLMQKAFKGELMA